MEGLGPTWGRDLGAGRGRKGNRGDEGEGATDSREQGKAGPGKRRMKSQKQLKGEPVFSLMLPLLRRKQMRERGIWVLQKASTGIRASPLQAAGDIPGARIPTRTLHFNFKGSRQPERSLSYLFCRCTGCITIIITIITSCCSSTAINIITIIIIIS